MVDARIEAGEQGWRFFSGLHRLLLRAAGRVPDDWLTDVRTMLDGGDLAQIPDTVSRSMVELGVSLTVGEVALLREIGRVFWDSDPMYIDEVPISEERAETGHRFFPVSEQVLATDAERIPRRLDLTGRPGDDLWDLPPELAGLSDLAIRLTDFPDQSPVNVLRDEQDVLSIARAWRFPPEGPLVQGVRVVLVEVVAFAPAWDIERTVRLSLERDDELDAQIEVFWTGEELPLYHQEALAGSALFWRAPAGRIVER